MVSKSRVNEITKFQTQREGEDDPISRNNDGTKYNEPSSRIKKHSCAVIIDK